MLAVSISVYSINSQMKPSWLRWGGTEAGFQASSDFDEVWRGAAVSLLCTFHAEIIK